MDTAQLLSVVAARRSPHQLISTGPKRQGYKSPMPAERLNPTTNWPQRNMVTPCQHRQTCGWSHNWSHGTMNQNLITGFTTTRKPHQNQSISEHKTTTKKASAGMKTRWSSSFHCNSPTVHTVPVLLPHAHGFTHAQFWEAGG